MKKKSIRVAGIFFLFFLQSMICSAAPERGIAPGTEYSAAEAQRVMQPGIGSENEGKEQQILPVVVEKNIDAGQDTPRLQALTVLPAQPAAPGPHYVWVEPYQLPNHSLVAGYWRPQTRDGFTWLEGVWNPAFGYIPGYWYPTSIVKKGLIWAPGYWLGDHWSPGIWRPAERKNFAWIPSHWSQEGEWIQGHWRPVMQDPANKIWVPGYCTKEGLWVPGTWRAQALAGAVWVGGYENSQGSWIPGHWRKTGAAAKPPAKTGKQRRHLKRQ